MSQFQKQIIPHTELYVVQWVKNENFPYLLFIHGGPGFNCSVLEYLIDNEELFQSINCNIILYDQRSCGRSRKQDLAITHEHNVDDLNLIISLLKKAFNIKPDILVGHSYGSKILLDYSKKYSSDAPLIFLSTSESLLRPRLNNLMLDLAYLKQHHLEKYDDIFNSFQEMDYSKLWELSETLTPYFQKNTNRGSIYWANIEWWKRVQKIQEDLDIPVNFDVFTTVRRDIYSSKESSSCDIRSVKNVKLWINGFHDFIMDGYMAALDKDSDIIPFYQSAHYPHIEENERFCRVVNEFFQR